MEKISGILRSSPRVTSVDLKAARPTRPGTPGFGAPEGESSLKDQVNRSTIAQMNPNDIDVPRWRQKEDAHVEIVDRITNSFFRKRLREPNVEVNDGFAAGESVRVPGGVHLMNAEFDDAANEQNRRFDEVSGLLNQRSDNSRTNAYFAAKKDKLNAATNKEAAYFQPENESESEEGFVLDTVA